MQGNFKPNSHKSKEQDLHGPMPEKRAEKVVTGGVKQRKSSGLTKLSSIFLPGDIQSVKSYILMDVIIPSIKRAILDSFCNGMRMLFGEPARSSNDPNRVVAKVGYKQYYSNPDQPAPQRPRVSSSFTYDVIIFEDRDDAEDVLLEMKKLIEKFDTVSVADMYDMAGLSCDFTLNKFGWTDLRGVVTKPVSDGYIIDLPKAVSLSAI